MHILRCGLLLAAGAVSAPAWAEVPPSLLRCSAQVKDGERLKCYDDAMKALSAEARSIAEQREKEAAVAAAAAAAAAETAARNEAAAEAAQKTQQFGKADAGADERLDELTARVTEAFTDSQRRQVFLLDNGQMWRQTDGVFLATVKPGSEAILKRGMLGSYRLTLPSVKRTVPVMRIR